MKKYYLFAALATAGLFASCSSEDALVAEEANEARQAVIDENAPAEIKLGVDDAIVVRGTGTVGIDPNDETNVTYGWQGQSFNVYMLEKNTLNLAHLTDGDAGIFNKAVINTIPGSTNTTIADGVKYYPQTGAYSFWAYRLDDASLGTLNGLDGDTAVVKQLTQQFTIDGTQDVMIGTAKTAAAVAALQAAQAGMTEAQAEERIYSAYSARRGVDPSFKFQHLLTRLVFSVKPAAKEVSDAAAPVAVGDLFNGFKVTKITVKSKTSGELVIAYVGDEPTDRIIWDPAQDWADVSTLTELELKDRGRAITQLEDGQYMQFNPQTVSLPRNITSTELIANFGAAAEETVELTVDSYVYDSNAQNPTTGKPAGNRVRLGDMIASGATEAYLYFKGQDMLRGGAIDANADLVDLEGVIPVWDATKDPNDPANWDNVSSIADMAPTKVGEALLVAPADENGYEVTVTYSNYKRTNAGSELTENNVITRKIQLAGTFSNDPFKAAKTYNVVITLYKDANMGGITVDEDGWTPASGDPIEITNEE